MKPYYKDNSVTIYHGDCREIVPTLGKFDLLLTDPPYGIGRDKGASGGGYDSTGKYKRSPRKYCGDWDNAPAKQDLIELCLRSAKSHIVWGGNYFCLPPQGHWLIWNKEQVMPTYGDAELAWTSLDGKTPSMFTLHCNKARTEQGLHPTQKPVDLIRWCISLTQDVQTILDPFAGSGTTGRAAKDLGRKATLIEREEKYCEIAARRCSQEVLPL